MYVYVRKCVRLGPVFYESISLSTSWLCLIILYLIFPSPSLPPSSFYHFPLALVPDDATRKATASMDDKTSVGVKERRIRVTGDAIRVSRSNA